MIKEFQNKYRWLSNFWPVQIKYKGRIFQSVEHAYMSEKNTSEIWKDFCISEIDPKKVKKMSMEICLRQDWEEVKVDIMTELTHIKYQNSELKEKLLATESLKIEEGNDWGDIFWGIDIETGKGKNILGNIIMKIRDEIKNKNA